MISKIRSFNLLFKYFPLPKIPLVTYSYNSFKKISLMNHKSYKFCSSKKSEDIQKIKKEGKQFYAQQLQRIIELEKSQSWQNVIPSIEQPLIIDFYADWCQPCKQLTPKLKQRVLKSKNTRMVMINIDKCPQIAHSLQIKSVPTVYLVYRNQAIDKFQGVPQDQVLDKFFEGADKIQSILNTIEQSVKKLDQAKKLMSQNKYQQAVQMLLEINKINDKEVEAYKEILLAHCYIGLNQTAKFKIQYEKLSSYEQFFMNNQDLKAFYNLMGTKYNQFSAISKNNPEVKEAQDIFKKQPTLQHRYNLALAYKKHQMNETALDQALEIVKQNKQWEGKKANKLILQIFKQLGNASPITQKYRKIFQRMLN